MYSNQSRQHQHHHRRRRRPADCLTTGP